MMLTDDMIRLRGEIHEMRRMRGAWINERKQAVVDLIADFRRASTARKQAVAGLLADFGSARTAMAKRTKNERADFERARTAEAKRANNERVAFVNNLTSSVRNDLAGARRAWAGTKAHSKNR